MTLDPARPRYTLPLAGTEYDLLGTLAVVEAVESALQDGILRVTARCPDLGVTDAAKLLSAVLTACGRKTTPQDAGELILNTLGVNSDAFLALKLHLFAFLRITLEPPELREAKAKDMGELLAALAAPPSPGGGTRKPASAGSAGSRRSSGGPPPGT